MTLYNNYDKIFIEKNGKRIGLKEIGIYDDYALAIGYKIQFFDANSGVFIGEQKYLFSDLKF